MTPFATAGLVRVLLLVDAVDRLTSERASDLDLSRLAYFVDAFADLWGLHPLDRHRLKGSEPRTETVRKALDRLVVTGVVLPSDLKIVDVPWTHLSARYVIHPEIASPVLRAIRLTNVGKREAALVEEVVYASAGLLEFGLADAFHLDAGQADPRLGPNDLLDLASSVAGTSYTARRFHAGVLSQRTAEAELTHLYMTHLERRISGG